MGFNPNAEEAKATVARYDKNRSGSMELDEWSQLVSDFRRLQDREPGLGLGVGLGLGLGRLQDRKLADLLR